MKVIPQVHTLHKQCRWGVFSTQGVYLEHVVQELPVRQGKLFDVVGPPRGKSVLPGVLGQGPHALLVVGEGGDGAGLADVVHADGLVVGSCDHLRMPDSTALLPAMQDSVLSFYLWTRCWAGRCRPVRMVVVGFHLHRPGSSVSGGSALQTSGSCGGRQAGRFEVGEGVAGCELAVRTVQMAMSQHHMVTCTGGTVLATCCNLFFAVLSFQACC